MISNEVILENLHNLYDGLAGQGLVASGSAGGFAFVRHDGFEWPNMAYRRTGTGEPAGGDIRLLKESVGSRRCPGLIILDREVLTVEMQVLLADERFVAATEWVNMALPVGGLMPGKQDRLQCRKLDAEDAEEWSQWAGVVSKVLFKGGRLDPALFRHPEMKKRFILMAGFVDGVPVATCLLHLADTAGLYMVATLPSVRGKGFGRLLIEHAQAEAIARGYAFVVLHSTKAGIPFYNKLGYRSFGKQVLYCSLPLNYTIDSDRTRL
jgi:ribosomal protein S18 acetylase RimI-like enzyme